MSSTHIIKPAIARFEGLVFNKAFCMKLAQAILAKIPGVMIDHPVVVALADMIKGRCERMAASFRM